MERNRPHHPKFASGPTRKINNVYAEESILGRSHRSLVGLKLIQELLQTFRTVLNIPVDYELALISGGSTGAMEFLLWNLVGPLPVDALSNGVFGRCWVHDLRHELKISPLRVFEAPDGEALPVSDVSPLHDTVFVWADTPSGTILTEGAPWISPNRLGLTLCDATAAVFCCDLPWERLDAVAFSWQKGIGGEAGLGTVVLSPRAMDRLESYTPPWPLPRLFRPPFETLSSGRRRIVPTFWQGATLNTVSLAVVNDMLFALKWAERQGGLPGLQARIERNYALVERWVQRTHGFDFLVQEARHRAHHIACLNVEDPRTNQPADWSALQKMTTWLEQQSAAFDVLNHRLTQPSLRLWLGPVVEPSDVEAVLPWLEAARDLMAQR